MKNTARTLIIIAIVVMLIIIGLLFVFKPSAPSSNPANNANATFPMAGSSAPSSAGTSTSNNSMSLTPTDAGNLIVTKNFLAASDVQSNPNNNNGYYVLEGAATPTAPNPPYEIDYSTKDQSFGITIYQEPLGTNRLKAEQDLMNRLGIDQSSMCRLNYILATGPGVSTVYNGENLDFSFCPNAVVLP